jgi:hypothetical protein
MRFILIMVICLLSNACGTGDSMNRTYVISKSHEASSDVDNATDELLDFDETIESSQSE